MLIPFKKDPIEFNQRSLFATNVYEVRTSLSNNLKGGYHVNCPFRHVGWGRVCVVTYRLNLPRQGIETARSRCGFYPVRDACQNRRPQHKANGAAS